LIANDQIINARRFEIEDQILALIATQQPVARDMRVLAAVLEIITELERIGDYAKGIAKINFLLGEEPLLKPLIDLPQMAGKARDMLNRTLEAFVWRDTDAARSIALEDDEVDRLFNRVERELMELVVSDPCPKTIERANHLLWAAHNLERAADRVTNICERIVFLATGRMEEMHSQVVGKGQTAPLHRI
jgi:phosphate transport system protein